MALEHHSTWDNCHFFKQMPPVFSFTHSPNQCLSQIIIREQFAQLRISRKAAMKVHNLQHRLWLSMFGVILTIVG